MKKIIKNPIFTFILGIILAGSIGVYASTQYMASQVTYNKNGKATVEAALNDLYDKSKHHHLIFSPVSEEEFESIGRSSFSVQAGTDEMYIVFSLGTNSSVGNPTISGDIVESSEQVGFNTYTDVHNNKYLRSEIQIYKVNLTGEAGNVNLSVSGGSGDYRAWTTVAIY